MKTEDLYRIYLECGCRVTTDSRTITGGELFFALKGENFDGNAYAQKALEAGAAYAVVDDHSLPESGRIIRTDDSFKALQDLAIWHRTHVRGGKLPVLGLTGTNGKTTTKELITAVLSKKYKVTSTRGNLNNDIGVPLSLLSITPDTELAVIEMGANHPDDVAKLVKVSRPDYGLITNVGKAHLLGFGSFEGVKAAKGELYKWLSGRDGSLIFINEDDADLRGMTSGIASHFFGYGFTAQKAKVLETSAESMFLRLDVDGREVRTNLVGAYNAVNVLAALAVGQYFGVPQEDAIAAVEGYVPVNNRSQMMKTDRNTLVVDAYNANPSSMGAAIDNFAAISASSKLALLGDMRELGADSVSEHVKIVDKLIAAGIDSCLVGDEFAKALALRPEAPFRHFSTSEELASALTSEPLSNTVVLVKGSRGIQMEKVIPAL